MSPLTYAYRWFTRGILALLGIASLGLGVSLVLGGPGRFTSSGFAAARLVPGGCYTWGIMFIVAGGATLLGHVIQHLGITRVGLLAEAAGYLFFVLGLTVSDFKDIHAAFTGVVTYLVLAVACYMASGVAKVIK